MDYAAETIRRLKSGPVIIWGTKTAGKICCRLLRKINADIVAAGDNDAKKVGGRLYGIPVLGLQEISGRYPEAVIVIGSFLRNISDIIITQLGSAGNRFTFCRFEEIEYLYEIICPDRKVTDREKLFRIINNIGYGVTHAWERKINRGVIAEYRYIVGDGRADDLKAALGRIYGVRNLVLAVGADKIKEAECVLEGLDGYGNAGHIIAIIEYRDGMDTAGLRRLAGRLFYIICDECAPEKFRDGLEKMGVAVETKRLPDGFFSTVEKVAKYPVTEKSIVEGIMSYAGKTDRIDVCRKIPGEEPVHIVQMFNGMANQMLMYMFGRFLEEETGRMVIFDDTILDLDIRDKEENIRRICRWNKTLASGETEKGVRLTREKNGFYQFGRAEVAEVFDIPIRLLSDYFDGETWDLYTEKIKKEHLVRHAQGFPLCHVLAWKGADMFIVRDTLMPDDFMEVKSGCIIDAYSWGRPYGRRSVTDFILNLENAYFIGVWATGIVDDWLVHNRQWARKIFRFQPDLSGENKEYIRKIKESYSVTLHIRRGDFAHFKMAPDNRYFREAVRLAEMSGGIPDKRFFIFSDDIGWCREHEKELGLDGLGGRAVFVSGNAGRRNYMDLYLMSLGKIIIPTPGSSFSYMAILLSETAEKYVCIPKYFYEAARGLDMELLLEDAGKVRNEDCKREI